jgi:hypothetical protein
VAKIKVREIPARVDRLEVLVAALGSARADRKDRAHPIVREPLAGCNVEVALTVAIEAAVVVASDRPEDLQFVGRLLHHEVDAAADRVGVHVGRQRLRQLHRLQQVRGDDVQRYLTDVGLGRRDAFAVDQRRVQPRFGAADNDVTALTLIPLNRNARNTLQGLGGVWIGKRADLIGGHDVRDVGSGLLLIQRPRLRVLEQRGRHCDRLFIPLHGRHAHGTLRRRARRHVDRHFHIVAADVSDDQRHVACRDWRQAKVSVAIGGCRDDGAFNHDIGARQRRAGCVVDDAANYRPGSALRHADALQSAAAQIEIAAD